jgi:TetR/AcrR family transcriptional regulator, copper-responsive repressor
VYDGIDNLIRRRQKMKGRPREFDQVQALDSAMRVFWQHGYEGTSLTVLTTAMKINRPSLYATFGDKEQLFFQVLDRYLEIYGTKATRQLTEHSHITIAIAAFFDCVVEQLTDPQLPSGCLIANSTLECGGGRFEAIERRLSQCHHGTTTALYARLQLARSQGELAEDEDIQALAQFFTATMIGMGAIVRTNPDRSMIRQLAKTALRVLPKI